MVVGNWTATGKDRKYKIRERGGKMQFTLHQEGTLRWRVNGTSSNGSRLRERFDAASLEEAICAAAAFLDPQQEASAPEPEVVRHDLAEAFNFAISASHGQPENKKNQLRYAGYFIEWAERNDVRYWCEVRRQVVDTYVNFLVKRGLKRKTILNYLEPIRLAGRRLVESFPEHYHNPVQTLRLRGDLGLDGMWREDDGQDVLSLAEVMEFAEWLKSHPRGALLRPGVLLSGVMGLRLREVVYLTWNSVDLVAGTVTIQAEPGHKPKNTYSVRKLPMPKVVWDCLREIPKTGDRVIPVEDLREQHRRSEDFHYYLAHYYSGVLIEVIRQWRPGSPLSGKDLRKTLQTHAIENSSTWNVYLVDRFCGHAPKSVMEKHYFGDRKARMVELFRQEVTARLDAELDPTGDKPNGKNGTKWHDPEVEASGPNIKIIEITDLMEA